MAVEQAVIVRFNYGIQGLKPLSELEDRLRTVIDSNNVGEYDGHEIAMDYSDGFLWMYGPDATKLYEVIKPVLNATGFMKEAKIKLRFGPPEDGVEETSFILN
jgi:hypothetical protein